ncbi:hypothetical protein [Flavonifractor plautii]|uniref:hypothetical protein n=1 Tax=Flavonifractor plautii TaxID=292800 RepID=UPI003AAE0497
MGRGKRPRCKPEPYLSVSRDVRNVFERAVARQSDRVAALEKPGKEELMALTVADLQEEGGPVPDGAPDETLPESP